MTKGHSRNTRLTAGWKQAEKIQEAYVGRQVSIKWHNGEYKSGIVTTGPSSKMRRCIVELHGGQGEIIVYSYQISSLMVWYDPKEEERRESEKRAASAIDKRPSVSNPVEKRHVQTQISTVIKKQQSEENDEPL